MKFSARVYICVLLSLLQPSPLSGAKILGFFATISRSHFIVEEPVMRELAKRGHEVTVVTSFKQSGEHLENYRYIEISDFINNTIFKRFVTGPTDETTVEKPSFIKELLSIMAPLAKISLDIMNHPKFIPLKNESFDLLILGWFLNEYALGLSGHFQCPSVLMSPNVNFYAIRKLSGNPGSMSTVTSAFLHSESPMTFLQRVKNFGANLMEYVLVEVMSYLYNDPLYLEAFPPDKYPPLEEVRKNLSLVLLTQHFSGRTPEALLPNVIEVQGMHVKKEPSPLPQDIKSFLDSATDGAIFFSLGSNARSADMSQEKIALFLNEFRTLKQKVLWKFETELPNLPDNVMIGKWLPQDDIFAHANVKLFISHCGLGGITEAKYHGVPILGIPLFADQFGNADHIVSEGWAVQLPFGNLNKETFSKALHESLYNSTYSHIAKKLSNLNRDRPEHPLDKAVFWIEYVIRHNGAKHMQSPGIHLNLLQFYMVDVYAFVVLLLYLIYKLIKILFKVFWRKVFGIGINKIKKD